MTRGGRKKTVSALLLVGNKNGAVGKDLYWYIHVMPIVGCTYGYEANKEDATVIV